MHKADKLASKNLVLENVSDEHQGEFNTGGVKQKNSLLNQPQSPDQKQNKEPDREKNKKQAHIKELGSNS